MGHIYKITNIITHDFYIGKTIKSPEERFQKHIYNSKHVDTHLYRAIRKYGSDNFIVETLETISDESLDLREKYFISELKPSYNMTKGGDGGDTSTSEKYRISIQNVHSNKDPSSYATYGFSGKKQSVDSKRKISRKNSYPVSCDGIEYQSINEAQSLNPGISIRKRVDSPNYPTFFRIREKRLYRNSLIM